MNSKTDLTQIKGWVILTPEGDDIHFVTWEDVLGASQYIKGHIMSESHYEQYKEERNESNP